MLRLLVTKGKEEIEINDAYLPLIVSGEYDLSDVYVFYDCSEPIDCVTTGDDSTRIDCSEMDLFSDCLE